LGKNNTVYGENNNIICHGGILNNKAHGFLKEFDEETGKLIYEGTYSSGNKQDLVFFYDQNGNKFKQIYRENVLEESYQIYGNGKTIFFKNQLFKEALKRSDQIKNYLLTELKKQCDGCFKNNLNHLY